MKKIRKISSSPVAIILVVMNLLFASCSSDVTSSNDAVQAQLSGEELFISLVFADGPLTASVPALKSVLNTNDLTKEQLANLKKAEQESIAYLKGLDAEYFEKFQKEIYTKDPEVIVNSIRKIAMDIKPFIDSKLAVHNLSVEKISKDYFAKNGKNIALSGKSQEQVCAVWVLAVGVVLVAVAIFYVAAISEVTVGMIEPVPPFIEETIAIQVAEGLDPVGPDPLRP
jgi:SdpC family antimicrobial peptide